MPARSPNPAAPMPELAETYQLCALAFQHALEARLLFPRTIATYLSAVHVLGQFLATHEGMPRDPEKIRRSHSEALLIDLHARGNEPNTIDNRRGLVAFFG